MVTPPSIPSNRRRATPAMSCVPAVALVASLGVTIIMSLAVHARPVPEGSVERVSRWIADSPEDAKLYLERARLYRALGAWDASLADFQRADLLDSRVGGVARLGMGRTLLEAGRAEEALAVLNELLATGPGQPVALITRARALMALERPSEAARDFGAVISSAGAAVPIFSSVHPRASRFAGAPTSRPTPRCA